MSFQTMPYSATMAHDLEKQSPPRTRRLVQPKEIQMAGGTWLMNTTFFAATT